jgi:hypothetical protein
MESVLLELFLAGHVAAPFGVVSIEPLVSLQLPVSKSVPLKFSSSQAP